MHLKYFKQQVNHFAIFLNYCSGRPFGRRDIRLPSVTIGDRAVNCMGRVLIKTFRKMWWRREIPAGLSVRQRQLRFLYSGSACGILNIPNRFSLWWPPLCPVYNALTASLSCCRRFATWCCPVLIRRIWLQAKSGGGAGVTFSFRCNIFLCLFSNYG